MANRRMFSNKVIDTDLFLDMPMSTQNLYFHLCMRADDDGFIDSPKRISRMIGTGDDDLKVLFTKRFVIPFESGVCVIRHWRVHNYIKKDRYAETFYKYEKSMLDVNEDGSYALLPEKKEDDYGTEVEPKWIQDGTEVGDKVVPQSKSKSKSKSKVSNNMRTEDDIFENLWQLYPEKKGKTKVSKKTKEELAKKEDQVMQAIENYITDTDERRKNFLELKYQYGSTFFNGGYVDYLPENFTPYVAPTVVKNIKKNSFHLGENTRSSDVTNEELEAILLRKKG